MRPLALIHAECRSLPHADVSSSPAPAETTEDHPHDHHHHHHHPHPYAEPPSPSAPPPDTDEPSTSAPDTDADEEAAVLPSRLDRLIAFLDSYFGQVELVQPSSSSPSPSSAPAAAASIADEPSALEPKPEPVDDATLPPEKAEDAMQVEAVAEADEVLKQFERPRAPVIRVTLDSYHADVRVEDLVRPRFSRPPSLPRSCLPSALRFRSSSY